MRRAVTAVAVVTAWAVLAGCGGGAAEEGAESPRTPRPSRTAESASPTPARVDPEAYWAKVMPGLDAENRPAEGPARVRHSTGKGGNVTFVWETGDERVCWATTESLGSITACLTDPLPVGRRPRVLELYQQGGVYGAFVLFLADNEKVASLSCGPRELSFGEGDTLSDGRRTVYAVHVPDSQPDAPEGAVYGKVTVTVERSSGPATEYLHLGDEDDTSTEQSEQSARCD